MLQLKGINKTYRTGDLVQTALNDVSLNLRDNEFVAILGPSGSGKTTLLNIIGGLDRYDSGDLIINGISTKKYTDRDWDSYRNHTIGFVFQSYNLIPHQTILANVELALTISGVSKSERRKRAVEALKKVGLGDQIHKKPNQMSGGQMQRVALARALINNPDILLADEPTGALDSDTSIQVMELLKEVAKDRLVVMVTHNPELAEKYATRIVRLRDGKIQSDTAPYVVDAAATVPPVHKNMGKSSMSFFTSLALSFNNLGTKRARTLLTAFAGSIGIIGIALILAISTGVNDYIGSIEEETLSEYPVQVTTSAIDLSSMMEVGTGLGSSITEENDTDTITVTELVTSLVPIMGSNNLPPLKEYLESGESDIWDYVKAIEYIYGVEPQIYSLEDDEYRQVHPDTTITSLMGMGSTIMSSTMMASMTGVNVFYQMPENENLYIDQYDVLAGRWPENYDECVLVLSSNGSISDIVMYTLGLADYSILEDLLDQFVNGENAVVTEEYDSFTYDEVLGLTFKLVSAADYYQYDSEYELWVDKTDDDDYMMNLVTNGEDLTIVGIVQPAEDAVSTALSSGINYLPSLVTHVSELAEKSEIVQAQMADPDTDVLTGEPFGEDSDADFDLESLFNIDTDALQDAFDISSLTDSLSDSLDLSDAFDLDADSLDLSSVVDFSDMDLNLDLTGMDLSSIDMSSIDLSGMDLDFDLDLSSIDLSSIDLSSIDLSQLGEIDMSSLMSGVSINVSAESVAALASSILSGYADYAEANNLTTYSDLSEDFSSYLTSGEARNTLTELLTEIMEENGTVEISREGLEDMLSSIVSDYESYVAEQMGSGDSEDEDGDETVSVSTADYLATGRAQDIFDAWAESHITVSDIDITDDQMEGIASALAEGYASYAEENNLTTVESVQEGFSEYLASDEATATMSAGLMSMLDLSGLESQMTAIVQSYTQSVMSAYTEALTEAVMSAMESQMTSLETQMTAAMAAQMTAVQEQITSAITEQMAGLESQLTSALSSTMESVMSEIVDQLSDSMETAMNDMMDELADSMEDALQIDEDALADAFEFNLDSDELMEIMISLSSSGSTSYESTLESLGYLDENGLEEIDLYPKDFDSKDEVLAILDNYNEMKRAAGDEDDVITYTDTVGTMMSSVTTIMDVISYVLIAFVSISLIVSSIMIGVITYISVLERTREIGILRAIGASKGNISQIFNAETLIIGLCAGLLGVGLSELLLIPINAAVHSVAGSTDINAVLTFSNAAILVALSMVLTFIGGLIPSGQAAKKDPVTALRTE
ncbi:MAG: ATP-binding cassette domain-containing protein [Clostridiales bacterium]|nr:ATP-binding cassette domain-containing protein [Clostridiales bacterium]